MFTYLRFLNKADPLLWTLAIKTRQSFYAWDQEDLLFHSVFGVYTVDHALNCNANLWQSSGNPSSEHIGGQSFAYSHNCAKMIQATPVWDKKKQN